MGKTKDNNEIESNALTLSPGFLDTLQSLMESGRLEEVEQAAKEVMSRKKILELYNPNIRPIHEKGRRIRYQAYIYDNGTRKSIKANSVAEVEEKIIQFHKAKTVQITTLKELYPIWDEYRFQSNRAAGTVAKDARVWKKYYSDSDIINVPFDELTSCTIERWLFDLAEKQCAQKTPFTVKRFREVKSVLNKILDYARKKGLIKNNPSRDVVGFTNANSELFAPEEEKKVEEQVFLDSDKVNVIDKCYEMYLKTFQTVYLAIILNFQLGLRVGEITAIKTQDLDFESKVLHLCRSETENFHKRNGKYVRDGYKVVNYLKSTASRRIYHRDVTLSGSSIMILKMILEHNERFNLYDDDFLFVGQDGYKIHTDCIDNALRRSVNSKLGITQRANHSIRKTVISEMLQSQKFSDKEIQELAGHADFSTTAKYYAFVTKDKARQSSDIESVLGVQDQLNDLQNNMGSPWVQ